MVVSRCKIGVSWNRRLLAFQSVMFGMVMFIPPPLNAGVFPLLLGLKMYRLFAVYLVFKSMMNPGVDIGLVNILWGLPRLVENQVATQLIHPLVIATSARNASYLVEPVTVNWINMVFSGVGAIVGLSVDVLLLYFSFIAPILFVRRKIYPRIKQFTR